MSSFGTDLGVRMAPSRAPEGGEGRTRGSLRVGRHQWARERGRGVSVDDPPPFACFSGQGTCDDGRSGSGECTCNAGYRGLGCWIACPGAAEGHVCSGHGTCDEDGACVCTRSAAEGHWAAQADCGACTEGWSGVACALLCPSNATSGRACSDRGRCVEGRCLCDAGTCGPACESAGAACGHCDPGTWGPGCAEQCPGGAASPCAGHGHCLDGQNGSGHCICDEGYAGADCSGRCPGAEVPCSGHGRCHAPSGTCYCQRGYAGAACAMACPRTGGRVCGGLGRGVCHDGAGGTGTCICAAGYAGPSCEGVCRGGAEAPCTGHGQCSARDGSCKCDTSWAGEACDTCAEVCSCVPRGVGYGRFGSRVCVCVCVCVSSGGCTGSSSAAGPAIVSKLDTKRLAKRKPSPCLKRSARAGAGNEQTNS